MNDDTLREGGGWLGRLRRGLSRSSDKLAGGITGLFTKRKLDDDALEDLEELLIGADLGVGTATRITGMLAKTRFNQEVTGDEVSGKGDEARAVLAAIEALGISFDDVVQVLEDEGVDKFDKSWAELVATVEGALDEAKAKLAGN